eukprot:1556625-Amphidinium_carterae.1
MSPWMYVFIAHTPLANYADHCSESHILPLLKVCTRVRPPMVKPFSHTAPARLEQPQRIQWHNKRASRPFG